MRKQLHALQVEFRKRLRRIAHKYKHDCEVNKRLRARQWVAQNRKCWCGGDIVDLVTFRCADCLKRFGHSPTIRLPLPDRQRGGRPTRRTSDEVSDGVPGYRSVGAAGWDNAVRALDEDR